MRIEISVNIMYYNFWKTKIDGSNSAAKFWSEQFVNRMAAVSPEETG